jgi:hypothetical protein
MHIAQLIEKNHILAAPANFVHFFGDQAMNAQNSIKIISAAIIIALATGNAFAAKGGNKGGNDGGSDDDGGGGSTTTFALESISPYIPLVTGGIQRGQGVFYGQMDLSEFPGTYDNLTSCSNGLLDGIIVIYPQSSKNPQAAEMIFWYDDALQSGDAITHLLTMTGKFDEPGNWPPTAANPETTVTLEYWEFAAENRKAQRQDCSGSYAFDGSGPWTVTVHYVE